MGFLSRAEAVLVMGAFFALVLQSALAATYTVGGASNWTIPSTPQLYTSWISGKTFKVGDVLVFNFGLNQHDVMQVTKTNYDSCGKTNSLESYPTPPVSIPLNSTGARYYICSVGSHCSAGQKVTITVSAATATSPSPSPSPSTTSPPPSVSTPPPSVSTPPSSSPSGTASPPPASSPGGSTTPPPPTSPSASPPSSDNSSASRLTASLALVSGVAALFFL